MDPTSRPCWYTTKYKLNQVIYISAPNITGIFHQQKLSYHSKYLQSLNDEVSLLEIVVQMGKDDVLGRCRLEKEDVLGRSKKMDTDSQLENQMEYNIDQMNQMEHNIDQILAVKNQIKSETVRNYKVISIRIKALQHSNDQLGRYGADGSNSCKQPDCLQTKNRIIISLPIYPSQITTLNPQSQAKRGGNLYNALPTQPP